MGAVQISTFYVDRHHTVILITNSSVADPENRDRGRREFGGFAPSGGAVAEPPVGVWGESRRSWSVSAFCVWVKAFS